MTTLRTDRLALVPLTPDDVESLLDFFNEPAVGRYLLDGESVDRAWVVAEVEASEDRFGDNGAGLWTMRAATVDGACAGVPELLGVVGFRPFFDPPELQLLYAVHPAAWGRGFATEAARAAVGHAFGTLGFDEVRAATDEPNAASIRVLEKLGMRRWKVEAGEPWNTLFYRKVIRRPSGTV